METEVYVGGRALPTVTNAFLDYAQVSAQTSGGLHTLNTMHNVSIASSHHVDVTLLQAPFNLVGLKFGGKRRLPILQKSSGVLTPVSPCRDTAVHMLISEDPPLTEGSSSVSQMFTSRNTLAAATAGALHAAAGASRLREVDASQSPKQQAGPARAAGRW